jgi:uncharacterized membrane protein (UPF0127 family)
MKQANAINCADGSPVARVRIATSMWARFWGLMGKRRLPDGEALLIDPCSSVHTMFMRFPIDVVYLDAENRVLKVVDSMKPWRASLGGKGAKRVLEMLPGAAAAAGLGPGAVLDLEPATA